jgi:Leucine-rich repeat (LRR) protein
MRQLSSDALRPLTLLTHLTRLSLTHAAVTHLEFLDPLTALEELNLSHNKGIFSLHVIGNLTSLKILRLVGCTGVTDVQPLKNMTTLRELHLEGSGVINPLSLSHLPNLKITGNGH